MMALKLKRISMRIKQKELANIAGISKQYLSDLENGRANNSSKQLMDKLALALNSSVQELFYKD